MKEYSIREISEMFHLPISTIRYYEEMGILTNIGRTDSGQRIFLEGHVNRLRTICCFKNTGMTIDQLKKFFTYEMDEPEHIDEILELLQEREDSVKEQLRQLEAAYAHVLRKVHYYRDVKNSLVENKPRPEWKEYRNKVFDD